MKAITFLEPNAGTGTNTDQTSYAGASQTPGSITDPMYFGVIALRAAGQTADPTLTGTNGLNATWTRIGPARNVAGTVGLWVFHGYPSSLVAGIPTADFGAETQDACIIKPLQGLFIADEIPIQTKVALGTGTSLSGTFDDIFEADENATLMFVGTNAASGSITLPVSSGNFLVTQANASDGLRLTAVFRPNEPPTDTIAVTTPSGDSVAIMLELEHEEAITGGSGGSRLIGLAEYGNGIVAKAD